MPGIDNNGVNNWQNGLCGCFGDCKICILSFLFPCYVLGKNAEFLGDDCCSTCCYYMMGCPVHAMIRWRIRQYKNIRGTMCSDIIYTAMCGTLTIAQEAQELGWSKGVEPAPMSMGRQ